MRATNVHSAWWATVIVFLVHGLVVATWVSRIPAIKAALGLNNAVLGLALLSSAAGAVFAIPFAGKFVSRYGSRIITTISSVAFCFSLVLPGFAVNGASLAAA